MPFGNFEFSFSLSLSHRRIDDAAVAPSLGLAVRRRCCLNKIPKKRKPKEKFHGRVGEDRAQGQHFVTWPSQKQPKSPIRRRRTAAPVSSQDNLLTTSTLGSSTSYNEITEISTTAGVSVLASLSFLQKCEMPSDSILPIRLDCLLPNWRFILATPSSALVFIHVSVRKPLI